MALFTSTSFSITELENVIGKCPIKLTSKRVYDANDYLVAIRDGEIAGFIQFSSEKTFHRVNGIEVYMFIGVMYTVENHQRKGVATELLNELYKIGKERFGDRFQGLKGEFNEFSLPTVRKFARKLLDVKKGNEVVYHNVAYTCATLKVKKAKQTVVAC